MRAWIPPNFTDNGNWFGGLVKKRNAAEAGVFLLVFFLILKALAGVIGIAAVFVIAIIIGLPAVILLVVGIGGQSVGMFLKDLIMYRKSRGAVTIRMPSAFPEKGKGKKGK